MTTATSGTPISTSRATARPGPDFMCVGLQKAGTQWLYDQLQNHDDFWMPPSKELHYFDRDFPDRKVRATALNFAESPNRVHRQRKKRGYAPVDERGEAFFERVRNHDAPAGDLDAYRALFAMKGDRLSGDITPAYSTLDDRLVAQLADAFPQMRVCLMLREPASRLWSQWRMGVDEDEPYKSPAHELRAFTTFTKTPLAVSRSYPSVIAHKWSAAFGDRFRYFFLEDVASKPEETRAEILTFLGGDPAKSSNAPPDFNRKAKVAAPRPEGVDKVMRKLFETERARCAEMFGGPATAWPDKPY